MEAQGAPSEAVKAWRVKYAASVPFAERSWHMQRMLDHWKLINEVVQLLDGFPDSLPCFAAGAWLHLTVAKAWFLSQGCIAPLPDVPALMKSLSPFVGEEEEGKGLRLAPSAQHAEMVSGAPDAVLKAFLFGLMLQKAPQMAPLAISAVRAALAALEDEAFRADVDRVCRSQQVAPGRSGPQQQVLVDFGADQLTWCLQLLHNSLVMSYRTSPHAKADIKAREEYERCNALAIAACQLQPQLPAGYWAASLHAVAGRDAPLVALSLADAGLAAAEEQGDPYHACLLANQIAYTTLAKAVFEAAAPSGEEAGADSRGGARSEHDSSSSSSTPGMAAAERAAAAGLARKMLEVAESNYREAAKYMDPLDFEPALGIRRLVLLGLQAVAPSPPSEKTVGNGAAGGATGSEVLLPLQRFNNFVCVNCHKKSSGIKKCAKCHTAAYCSRECQKQHWRIHKQECAWLATATINDMAKCPMMSEFFPETASQGKDSAMPATCPVSGNRNSQAAAAAAMASGGHGSSDSSVAQCPYLSTGKGIRAQSAAEGQQDEEAAGCPACKQQ